MNSLERRRLGRTSVEVTRFGFGGAPLGERFVPVDNAMADEVLIPLRLARVPGGGPITDDRGAGLTVEGAEVSALRRERGALTVRVFNPGPAPSTVTIEGGAGWVEDLRGRPLAAFDGTMELGPWQIATVRLDADLRRDRPGGAARPGR